MSQQPNDLEPENDQLDEQVDEQMDDQQIDDQAGEEPAPRSDVGKAAPAWLISLAIHATIALIFSTVVFSQKEEVVELPPMRVTVIDAAPEKPKEEKKEERALETKNEIVVETQTDVQAPVTPVTVDVKVEAVDQKNEPKGREEAISTSEAGGQGVSMAIGVGGGGAGMMGSRSGGGKRTALRNGGGSKASESAVDAALRWFKKHQSPNGMWDVTNYYQNCTDGQKCEPGGAADLHKSDCNVAITGYAVLCFLGAGYDHKTPNKYKSVVENAITWLKAQQKSDGLLGPRNYEQGVAAMALAEAYGMTMDAELREPAQKAINAILKRQNQDKTPMGWDYINPTGRNDASVTGWCVMALKSALAANLNVGNGMSGAMEWLRQSYELANPGFEKLTLTDQANFAYSWKAGKIEGTALDRVPMGALCAVFLGHHKGDKMLETMINTVMAKQVPTAWPANAYYLYYNTLAVYQAHGTADDPIWQKWNGTVRDLLVQSQRQDGCFNGSWDIGSFAGSEVGRTLTTAFCCLSLEVYYRYKQIGNK